MSQTPPYRSSVYVDLARSFICREVARVLEPGGVDEVRICVHHDGLPSHVWIYARRDNAWVKQREAIDQAELSDEVNTQLEILARRGKTDELSVRRHCKPDFDETDLQFNSEWLERCRGASLASRLASVLFRDSHNSHNDARQRIRTPHPGDQRL
ncbi:MAG: hypothetical protein U0903_20150 [Planctomycetales bacterium]